MIAQDPNHFFARIAGVTSIVAGFLHATVVAVQHWTPFPPLEGVFFIVAGLMQVVVGILFLPHPSIRVYRFSLFLNGGLAFLYFLLGFFPAPFVGEPEAFEALGLSIVSLEIVAVTVSLVWLLSHREHSQNTSFIWATSNATIAIIVGGFGFYGSAQGMELFFPDRAILHDHGMQMHDEGIEVQVHHDIQEQDFHARDNKGHGSPMHHN